MDSIPDDVWVSHLLEHISFDDFLSLRKVCKTLLTKFENPQFWFAFVSLYNIVWNPDDFMEEDTGGTSIRGIISEEINDVEPYLEYEKDKAILKNPKGLLLDRWKRDKTEPYSIIYRGWRLTFYGKEKGVSDLLPIRF